MKWALGLKWSLDRLIVLLVVRHFFRLICLLFLSILGVGTQDNMLPRELYSLHVGSMAQMPLIISLMYFSYKSVVIIPFYKNGIVVTL